MDVSPVIGSGFPVERAPADKFPTLVVFATGTGIAPIKALIDSASLDVRGPRARLRSATRARRPPCRLGPGEAGAAGSLECEDGERRARPRPVQVARRKDVRVYYGTFNPDSTAYADQKAQWEAAGVRVINVYSGFGQGYVQDVFTKARPRTRGAAPCRVQPSPRWREAPALWLRNGSACCHSPKDGVSAPVGLRVNQKRMWLGT